MNLEDVIRQHVSLSSRPNSGGWWPVLCKLCHDHGRKGKRGGFKFEGDTVLYHCFNCGQVAAFDPSRDRNVSSRMADTLASFGILPSDWAKVTFAQFGKLLSNGNSRIVTQHEPHEIKLPDNTVSLLESSSKWKSVAEWYLETRHIDPSSYPFYLCNEGKWKGRLIVPYYKGNRLIYYQGRDMTDKQLKRYESPSSPKDKVMYGYDFLFNNPDQPLFVVEGWFDAYHINGVAVLGKELTATHMHWLSQSSRKKIVIPDRSGKGAKLAYSALANGWEVSFPDIGSCEDISKAIVKYGKLHVVKSIMSNIKSKFEAETFIKMQCK